MRKLVFGTAFGAALVAVGCADVPRCPEPTAMEPSALPFDWVVVTGVPEALGPAVAEVSAEAAAVTGLTLVERVDEDRVRVQVPLHPTLNPEGGMVELRITGDEGSCGPVEISVEPLPPSPGAFARSVGELREALELLVRHETGRPDLTLDGLEPEDLPPHLLPLLAWTPLLVDSSRAVTLQRIARGDGLLDVSPDLLDRLAARIEAPEAVEAFRALVMELARPLPVPEARPPQPSRTSRDEPGGRGRVGRSPAPGLTPGPSRPAGPIRFAALELRGENPAGTGVGNARSVPAARFTAGSFRQDDGTGCDPSPFRLFKITSARLLDHYMRKQYAAERFLSAAEGGGGNPQGKLFSDLGSLIGMGSVLGPKGRVVAEIWGAFESLVLNTLEGHAHLFPHDLALVVTAEPATFEEDHPGPGWWSARAVAHSQVWNLNEKVFEAVLEKGLEGASVGTPLRRHAEAAVPDRHRTAFWEKVGDAAADRVDEEVLQEPAKEALATVLDALGATEGPEGFHIPAQCWEIPDMSPVLEPEVLGDAVELGAPGSRQFLPRREGRATIEVWTESRAFGNKRYRGRAPVEVLPIRVELTPTITRVEPGDPVLFDATVHDALDTRVRWSRAAGEFDELVDFGDGTHHAVYLSPEDPEAYPVAIKVTSFTERRGARAAPDAPPRMGRAWVQIDDPLVSIEPPGACLEPGEEKRFAAEVLGVREGRVRWNAEEGRFRDGGVYVAPDREGGFEITATYVDDPDASATVTVTVGECASHWAARISGAAYAGAYDGPFAVASLLDGRIIGITLKSDPSARPWVQVDVMLGEDSGVQEGSVTLLHPMHVEVAFFESSNTFESVQRGTAGGLVGSGQHNPGLPPPATLTIREVSEERVVGSVDGVFFRSRRRDVRSTVTIDFTARACRVGGADFDRCTSGGR